MAFFRILDMKQKLIGGSTTHLKNMLVKLDHFPRDRGENKKNWNHHLATIYPPNININMEINININHGY